ncbi:hypothetical protein D5687_09945 [Guyparkeria sp. SCN-R1]|uniref:hypothetical protein n=1 Tax=Guyparkeria sp. SCN-R1 TaxID=2341113 RepID=UPI000F654DC7|nr:hypothetical protein [Guyparkeria sp. SCN-R1]RRQ20315.1 hypothetical protein D5687_09945 [Guyparkeria sp. SCN-R1]
MSLIRLFFQLLFLRAGPEDMPAGQQPLLIAVGFYLVVGVLLDIAVAGEGQGGLGGGLGGGLLLLAADAVVLVAYSAGLAMLRNHRPRIPQMLTALFGAMAMLGLVAWPLVAMQPTGAEAADIDTQLGIWSMLMIALFAWNLLVLGQIYRRTLDFGAAIGVLTALGYFILSSLVYMGLAVQLLPGETGLPT